MRLKIAVVGTGSMGMNRLWIFKDFNNEIASMYSTATETQTHPDLPGRGKEIKVKLKIP